MDMTWESIAIRIATRKDQSVTHMSMGLRSLANPAYAITQTRDRTDITFLATGQRVNPLPFRTIWQAMMYLTLLPNEPPMNLAQRMAWWREVMV